MLMSVLGTGRMGTGLIKTITPHVSNVLWGSRSYEKVKALVCDGGYSAVPVTYEDALEADIIIHTLWLRDAIPWLENHKEQMKGKILVDIVNPFTDDFSDFTLSWGTSAAEELQKIVPETKVVGAFKNTFWSVFDQPIHNGLKSDVYITADDEWAKKNVMTILKPTNFRFLDAGSLKNNRTIERMTLFERELAIRHGHYPRVSFRLWGYDE